MTTAVKLPKLAFVDIETISLADHGEALTTGRHVWEVGLITPRINLMAVKDSPPVEVLDWFERSWFVYGAPLGEADARSLEVGGYFKRYNRQHAHAAGELARDLMSAIPDGYQLVGSNVSFDEERLRHLMRTNDTVPRWSYHMVDVRALAIGALASRMEAGALDLVTLRPPVLFKMLGVDVDEFEKHTALGDARLAKAVYENVMGDWS